MRGVFDKNELSKILIHGYEDTFLHRGPSEQYPIPWIRAAIP